MTKGNKKQRKRVAKTLSKAFRKLEVGQSSSLPTKPAAAPSSSQRRENDPAVATTITQKRNARHIRKRQEQPKKTSAAAKHVNTEQSEFDREQASLHERCWKRNGTQSKKKQNTRVIELHPPVFTISPQEDTIQKGIAALEGIGSGGGASKYIMSNGLGEAASSFLLQQAQKKAETAASASGQNRFAALLANDNDNTLQQDDQFTPTPVVAEDTTVFQFPPPLLQLPRPRMRGMPEAPLISSLDGLDV